MNLNHDNFSVALDVNVFEKIIDKNQSNNYLENFHKSISKLGCWRNNTFGILSPPFFVLELYGLGPKVPKTTEVKIKTILDCYNSKCEISNFIINSYTELERVLEKEFISLRIAAKKRYKDRISSCYNSVGIEMMNHIYNNNIEDDGRWSLLKSNIILDRIFSFEYKDVYKKHIISFGITESFKGLGHDHNLNAVRLGNKFLKATLNDKEIRSKVPNFEKVRPILESLLNDSSYKDKGDYLDTELVNIAIIGGLSIKKRVPTLSLTSDPYEKVKSRVALHKLIMKLVKSSKKTVKRKEMKYNVSKCQSKLGAIGHVSSVGEIQKIDLVKNINVSNPE